VNSRQKQLHVKNCFTTDDPNGPVNLHTDLPTERN